MNFYQIEIGEDCEYGGVSYRPYIYESKKDAETKAKELRKIYEKEYYTVKVIPLKFVRKGR